MIKFRHAEDDRVTDRSIERPMIGALMFKDKQHQTMKLSAVEKNIDDAIQRVYDAYGTDLPAFFKKIQRESQAGLARGNAPDGSVKARRGEKVRPK